jgi:Fungal specific transcription factor domain
MNFHSVPLYDIQVISNLVYYYSESVQIQNGHNKKRQSWLMQLPDMAHSTSLHRMRAPLLAPSLLLLALQSRQQNVLKEALKWYDLGLNYVRKRLKDLDTNVPDEREDKFLICAALLMSFYETLNDTTVGGYEQHVLGAVALLEAKGPEMFSRPEYNGLFRAIRGHAVCQAYFKLWKI